ncbi:T9SS type A sorting domain-containing protein [candidate division WOR-3 bacterium]|nr:T9SS type A sorting domain-containing protein [candidate division WOR-3 bacterium]
MKKALLLSITTLLVFAGGASADLPIEDYVRMMIDDGTLDYNGQSKAVLYDGASGNVRTFAIHRYRDPDSVFSTAVWEYDAEDGTPLGKHMKNIGGNHTVAKAACEGGAPGEAVTAGYWDTGTKSVFWTAGFSFVPSGWTWDIVDESDQMEQANKVVTDEYGNIYVAGNTWSAETGADIVVHKYDSNHDEHVWNTTLYEEGDDYAYGISIGSVENEFLGLAVESDSFLQLFKLDQNGKAVGSKDYRERANKWSVDPSGTVWTFHLNPYHSAADSCFYVSGTLDKDSDRDFWLACCDYEGNYIWEKTFDGGHDDWANAITAGFGYLYVAGSSHNGTDYDCRVIRYDETGSETWNITYGAKGDQGLSAITLDPQGNFYVAGYTGDLDADSTQAFLIKYRQPDVIAVAEQPVSTEQTIKLEVVDNLTHSPSIRYSLPAGQYGILSFYSADGRKLESYALDPEQSTFLWDLQCISSGVYFVLLESGSTSISKKALVVR